MRTAREWSIFMRGFIGIMSKVQVLELTALGPASLACQGSA